MAYVRKVVTASGATAVQVCEKVGGQQKVLAHIGSAHDEVSLALLMDKARNWGYRTLSVSGLGLNYRFQVLWCRSSQLMAVPHLTGPCWRWCWRASW